MAYILHYIKYHRHSLVLDFWLGKMTDLVSPLLDAEMFQAGPIGAL